MRILDAIVSQAWAIDGRALQEIWTLAQRRRDTLPESLFLERGRQLENSSEVIMRGSTAIVPLIGPIFPRANLLTAFSGATSLQRFALDFEVARKDTSVTDIVLHIDSPGGVVTSIGDAARVVHDARGDKPITAFVEGIGASAAYWIASAASEVVISETAMVGSIGVVQARQVQEQPDQDGMMTIEIVSSNAAGKRPDPRDDAGLASIRAELDAIESVFVGAVTEQRGIASETVTGLQGGVRVGADAVSIGLADGIGTLESVLADLAGRRSNSQTIVAPATRHSGDQNMDYENLTLAGLREHRADLVEAITTESLSGETERLEAAEAKGLAEGAVAGAEAERERIKAIDAAAEGCTGIDDLVAEMKADGQTTGEQASGKILAALKQNGANVLANLAGDDPENLNAAPQGDGNGKVDPKAHAAAIQEYIAEAAESGRKVSYAAASAAVRSA